VASIFRCTGAIRSIELLPSEEEDDEEEEEEEEETSQHFNRYCNGS